MLPKSLDEQIAGIETLIAGRRGFQLGSFLLFVDSYLLFYFKVNLFSLNWNWAKSHIGLGAAATIVFFYFILAGLLLPLVQFFLLIPSIIGSEVLIHRWAKYGGEFVKGVDKLELLQFALVEDNGIAYQEYLKKEREATDYLKDINWKFVFLCALGLDAFAAMGPSESLLEVLWSALRRMPSWIFYPSIATITISLLMLFISTLIAVRFTGKYYFVSPRLYQLIRKSLLPDQDEATDLEEVEKT